jgi:putative hemolysin
MKRLFIYTALLLALVMGFSSCYKDIIKPELEDNPDGPPKQVSFKAELAPLFSTSCAKSGCHVTGAHKPYLETAISYQQIVNGGFVNLALPKESILYKNIYGEMAEHIPSKTDKQKVYDWIRNGAPNN